MVHRARLYLAKKKGKAERAKRLLDLAEGNPDQITAQMISQAAAEGDDLSQRVIREAAERLGLGLAGAITLMNPDQVILGGGVIKSGEAWWQVVRETARAQTPAEISVEIIPAALGDDAPLWGAAALAEDLLEKI
jgi:glucokinase